MIALVVLSLAAQTPQSPDAGGRGASRSVDDESHIVCKSNVQTGSRAIVRRCMTAAQWDRMSEEHRRAWAEIVNRPVIETGR